MLVILFVNNCVIGVGDGLKGHVYGKTTAFTNS